MLDNISQVADRSRSCATFREDNILAIGVEHLVIGNSCTVVRPAVTIQSIIRTSQLQSLAIDSQGIVSIASLFRV